MLETPVHILFSIFLFSCSGTKLESRLSALDEAPSGLLEYQWKKEETLLSRPTATQDSVYVCLNKRGGSKVMRFGRTGAEIWSTDINGKCISPILHGPGFVFLRSSTDGVMSLDERDGRVNWKSMPVNRDFADQRAADSWNHDGLWPAFSISMSHVFAASNSHIFAFSVKDGSVSWTNKIDGFEKSFIFPVGDNFALSRAGSVSPFHSATSSENWGDGSIRLLQSSKNNTFEILSSEERKRAVGSARGHFSSAPVEDQGHLFFMFQRYEKQSPVGGNAENERTNKAKPAGLTLLDVLHGQIVGYADIGTLSSGLSLVPGRFTNPMDLLQGSQRSLYFSLAEPDGKLSLKAWRGVEKELWSVDGLFLLKAAENMVLAARERGEPVKRWEVDKGFGTLVMLSPDGAIVKELDLPFHPLAMRYGATIGGGMLYLVGPKKRLWAYSLKD